MPDISVRKKPEFYAGCIIATFSVLLSGCKQEQSLPEKAPRAVSVITLKRDLPPTTKRVTGSVGSWKTEQIGFEVAGRVRWVLEPGADIEGRVLDTAGNVVIPGTELAQVDDERYQLALESAKAQVEVAQLQRASVQVNLDSGIPADLEAARADLELAEVEYQRNQRLVSQNATAQADLDQAAAKLRTAKARISTIEASTKQTQAQLKSAVATIKQAQQTVNDANRNLADTKLYSSFRGQVAEIHVVPGSVVAQGTPVLTVQMMDPIKVEVELSAEESRSIQMRSRLPVSLTMPDGTTSEQSGYVYMVDPSADPTTRTFTLTLLLLNRKIERKMPEGVGSDVARTSDLWRMDFDFLPDAPEGTYYVEKKSIRQDAQGHFLWKCLNVKVDEQIPRLISVGKMRVVPGELSVPFLGNWIFQTIRVPTGEDFNPKEDLFAGELKVAAGEPDQWDGSQVIVDMGGNWMLRPGDLVTVDLSTTTDSPGFYLPMEAIYEDSGKTYCFVATETGNKSVANQLELNVDPSGDVGIGTVRLVEPVEASSAFREGAKVIVSGVHFLQDGEEVRIEQR